jgi:hypothetical protein
MSRPSAAKRARQQRRETHVARRKMQRRLRAFVVDDAGVEALALQLCDDHALELADKLLACVERWRVLPVDLQVEERCPFCEALVLVLNKGEQWDASHALPMCELWIIGMEQLGAHSPRVTVATRDGA